MNLTNKLTIVIALILATSQVQAHSEPKDRYHYTNPNGDVDVIVIHAIGGPYCDNGTVKFSPAGKDAEFWKSDFEANNNISIHYIIDREGKVASSIPEENRADHAWGHNYNSIGIELVNNGDGKDKYPSVQLTSLLNLVTDIAKRRNLKSKNIVRHSDIDTRFFTCGGIRVKKKQDPGPAFPWSSFKADVATALGESTTSPSVTPVSPSIQ